MRVARHLLLLLLGVGVVGASVPARAAEVLVVSSERRAPTDAEMIGTWEGIVMVEGASEPMDGGFITISRTDDERLAVTVGPDERVRISTARLTRTDEGLRFEVRLPGEDTRLLAYDVAIDENTMTGTVTFVRHGLTQPARLTFSRVGTSTTASR